MSQQENVSEYDKLILSLQQLRQEIYELHCKVNVVEQHLATLQEAEAENVSIASRFFYIQQKHDRSGMICR